MAVVPSRLAVTRIPDVRPNVGVDAQMSAAGRDRRYEHRQTAAWWEEDILTGSTHMVRADRENGVAAVPIRSMVRV
jgi:hypothetical protein